MLESHFDPNSNEIDVRHLNLPGKKEIGMPSLEQIKKEYDEVMRDIFNIWFDAKGVEPKPILIDPRIQDYKALAKDAQESKFGEYTINPEMQGFDFVNIAPERIKILEFPPFAQHGKSNYDLAEFIIKKYGDTHHIPGIEFWK